MMQHREWFTSFYSRRYWKVWPRVSHSPSLLPVCCVYSYFWKRWWKLLTWHPWIIAFLYNMERVSSCRTRSTRHCQCWLCLAKQHLWCVHLMSCFWGPWWPLLVSFIEPEICILGPSPSTHPFLRKGCCHLRQDRLPIPLSITPGCLRHSGLSSSCWVFSSHLCLHINQCIYQAMHEIKIRNLSFPPCEP